MRCINLADERPDRKEAMKIEMRKIGLTHNRGEEADAIFFKARRSQHGPLTGVYESHRACIREAYEAGAKTLLLFEDDVVFHKGWEEVSPF